jgi:hypothetical protein
MDDLHFDLKVDGVPYDIIATPYDFNGETRYYVSYNEGASNVFAWDSDLKRLTAIDDESSDLPEGLEEAISLKLQPHHI